MEQGPGDLQLPDRQTASYDVVALAASAGSLQAILHILNSLPADFAVPVIVMIHPRAGSANTLEFMGQGLPFTVERIGPASLLTPGKVLVCPPESSVELLPQGTFVISPEERGALETPVDRLFDSLARNFGPRAIGVLLAGLQDDGASGAQRLHLAGGKVLLQEEAAAEYSAMPGTDLLTDVADLVLPLQDIGQAIGEIVAGPHPQTLRSRDRLARNVAEDYRTLFDNIDEGVAMCELVRDEDGLVVDYRFLDVNPAFERHMNFKRADVIGRLRNEVFPQDRDALAMYASVVSSNTLFRQEYFSKPFDQWFDVTVVPRGADRFAVVFDNITRHKRAEHQLRQAAGLNAYRVKLSDALDPLGDPLQILKEAMRVAGEQLQADRVMYAEVDEQQESIFIPENYVRGDLTPIRGRFSLQMFWGASETQRRGQLLVINDIHATPGLEMAERENLSSVGVTAALAVPLIKDGRWVASLCIQHNTARDWTISETALVQETAERTWSALERARAEAALRRSETRYRMLHENLRDAFVQVDMNGNIISFNEIYCEMLGYPSEELQKLTFRDLTPERWHAFEENIVREQVLPRGFSDVYEKEYRRKDGTVFPVELRTILGRDPSGQPNAMWAIIRDITDRKRAEEALRENEKQLQHLNESLEQKVEEKTSELRLLASELTRAEQRERNRISHILHDDLQQRIYAVQMQLSFLRQELSSENQSAQREISDIDKELDDILKIARNLSIDLNPPILRGEGLAQAIAWLASKMHQQYGLPIEIHAEESFTIEDEELHVLLFNCVRELLFNAVKHAEASQADVRLQWVESGLCIEVTDNGRGLPVTASGEKAGGAGEQELQTNYGLSTIRHQLSLYGGWLEMHSQPGAGTQILLTVPTSKTG